MSQIDITTSQNINIQYQVAGIGERIAAFLIDMIIKIAYIIVLYTVLSKFLNIETYFNSLDRASIVAILTMITLPVHLYTLVFESLMEGQTPGKRLMKIRVVKIDGYQASFGDYLVRWVFRLIDIASNSGVVGIISMIVSKNNQRLGGIASGTAVISLKNKTGISQTILEHLDEGYTGTYPQVVALTDNDVRIIKETFTRAMTTYDRQVISAIAAKIRETIKLDPDQVKQTEQQFIRTVIKDYSHYTGRDE